MKTIFLLAACVLTSVSGILSQNYHSINGSSYAGALGVINNPGSIVNNPDKWDITLFSAQAEASTNAVTIVDYSLLSSPYSSQYMIDNGNYSRYANSNFNIHLLNTRYAINRKQAVAFGVNLRGYQSIKSGPYNFLDTVKYLRSFIRINENTPVFYGQATSSVWMEFFGTYAQTIFDSEKGRLNGGLTVKFNRGLSGMHAGVQNITVGRGTQGNTPVYVLQNVNASYGYSDNIDSWAEDKGASRNVSDLYAGSQKGLSIDIGFEYLVKSQAVSDYYDEDNFSDYEWKVSAALLDIGRSNYTYGRHSRAISNVKRNVSHLALERKFLDVKDMRSFNDSMATIVNTIVPLSGGFHIANPLRLVMNVDRSLINNFYLNADISVNLASLSRPALAAQELNLVTFTPRWETRRLGFFLPVQYNTKGQLWIGGALKAGPVLMGVHNLGYIFSKSTIQNGGAYLAFVIRPGKPTRALQDKRYDCPR